jgi:hypothetical protein
LRPAATRKLIATVLEPQLALTVAQAEARRQRPRPAVR